MRILMVTEGFNPEPHFKGLSFCRALMRRGHEVEVITGFPNYPGGKVYPGYRIRLHQKEILDGVTVHRVPLYPSHDGSAIRRIATYCSFALSAAFLGPWLVRRADIVYVYHPPATIALPGLILRLFKGRRVVYDIQDMWPDTLTATGMVKPGRDNWILAAVTLWCKLTYRLVDHIVVLSHGFKRLLIERGVPESKITVIRNWADEAAEQHYPKDPARASELGFDGRFTILFAGQMGKAQALDAVLDAAKIVASRDSRIQFAFIGGGIEKERLIQRAREEGIANTRFLDKVPITEIGHVLAQADALLVHLRNDPLFEITIPSKIQGYLASGRPILAAIAGEGASIVTEAGAGISCPPESPTELAEAACRLASRSPEELAQMGFYGRKHYESTLAVKVGVEQFESLFKGLLRKS